MFRGINAITIDGKGRFSLPARYRDILGINDCTSMVVTIDTEDPCLLIYPTKQWQIIEDNLQRLPSFNHAARRIQRLLIGHATDVDLDANHRLLLPALLLSYAQLDKHGVLIGQGNKFELWSDALWQEKRTTWLEQEAAQAEGLPEEMKTFFL